MIETVVKMLFIVLVIMGAFLPLITWVERKQSAVMQDRIGANRADLFGVRLLGLLHPAADVLKLLSKEDVVPRGANRVMHLLAPVIALVPAIVTLAVIPYGGVYRFAPWYRGPRRVGGPRLLDLPPPERARELGRIRFLDPEAPYAISPRPIAGSRVLFARPYRSWLRSGRFFALRREDDAAGGPQPPGAGSM